MITTDFKEKFSGDSGIDLARQEVDARFPDGEKIRIILRLGSPYSEDACTKIRVEIENLDRTESPLTGADAFQALIFGILWFPKRMAVFEENLGCKFFWPESDEPFTFETFYAGLKF